MDVNPKFNSGPTGVEYTSNLNAYDCLNVQLVHGWLIDPQDEDTLQWIGKNKTYNELIELVIHGQEASAQLESLTHEISNLSTQLDTAKNIQQQQLLMLPLPPPVLAPQENIVGVAYDRSGVVGSVPDDGWVQIPSEITAVPSTASDLTGDTASTAIHQPQPQQQVTEVVPSSLTQQETELQIKVLVDRLDQLRQKERELTDLSMKSMQIDHFLTTTSHQLTHYGLHELYAKIQEHEVCVFFRNNHFATMTKQNGVLYLLVTDLGYATVPDVVWEKLDAIDGDTEYVNSHFHLAKPQSDLLPGITLTPEQLLAQQGQTESDYQLALQLSQNPNGQRQTQQQQEQQAQRLSLEEEEGRLMAAATEASLREYNGYPSTISTSTPTAAVSSPAAAATEPCTVHEIAVGVPTAPPESEDIPGVVVSPPPPPRTTSLSQDTTTTTTTTMAGNGSTGIASAAVPSTTNNNNTIAATPVVARPLLSASFSSQEEADKAFAMKLQAEWENEMVARQIQQEQQQQQQQRRIVSSNNNSNQRRPNRPNSGAGGGGGTARPLTTTATATPTATSTSSNTGCVIS